MTKQVILGYDGGDGSRAALRVAVQVAEAFQTGLAVVFGYEPSPVSGESSDYRRQLEKLGAEVVGQAVAEARRLSPGIDVEPLVVPLRPVESLLEAANERSGLIIVVGGNGERPIVGAILGSVPHKLLHLSSVPVLVVPMGEETGG